MGWIATIADRARARDGLSRQEASFAVKMFAENGCLVLRNCIDPALLDAASEEWRARYGGFDAAEMSRLAARKDATAFMDVGHRRFEISPRLEGAFAKPELFANPILLSVLAPLLGAEIRLNSFTCVISFPGSEQQHIHRDHGHLFEELGPELPTYAVNCAIPLVDVDLEMGPTGVWPGTHRERESNADADAMSTSLRRGDVMMMDYRTLHSGLPNRSDRARPVLYLVYARPWFFDEQNHLKRSAVDMPLEVFEALPASAKPLMTRALAREMRNRHGAELDGRGALGADIASAPLLATDEGLCPCGNGRPFSSCHGRG